MPIVYETAAPVAQAAAVYQQQAQQQADRARASAFGGGGGAGARGSFGGGGVPYDPGAQDAVLATAALRQRAFAQANEGAVTDAQVYATAAAERQQQQRFQFQVELQQTELTQQEKMRLARMKNAVGEVMNDPNLTDDEKADLALKLKTGIDPMDRRLAQSRLAVEQQYKENMVKDEQAKAALIQNNLKVATARIADRQTYIVDPGTLAEISADIRASLPPGAADMVPPETIEQMARERAMQQKLGVMGILQPDGKVEPFGAKSGKGGAGAGDEEETHPLGITSKDYLKERGQALKTALAMSREQITNADNTKQLRYPGMNVEGEVRKILGEAGLPPTLEEFQAGVVRPEKKGYKPIGQEQPAAAATGGGTVDNPITRAAGRLSGGPAAGKNVRVNPAARASTIDDQAEFIRTAQGIDPIDRAAAGYLLKEIKKLAADHPIVDERPDDVKKKLEQMIEQYDRIAATGKAPEPVAGKPVAAAAGAVEDRSLLDRGVDFLRQNIPAGGLRGAR